MKNRLYFTPIQIIFIIASSIFVIEAAVMFFFYFFHALPELFKAVIDPAVLVLTLSPVLYLFIFRPLIRLIDEREAAQNELRKERDMAQRYLDVAGVILIVLDAGGAVTLINRKGNRILGYEEKDIRGKNWLDNFVPRKLRGEVELAFERLKAGDLEENGYFEYPVLTKSGEERIVLWQNRALRNEGVFTGVLASGEDITERKRAEKALKESENRYRLVHNTAFDGIITASADDVIIDCNPAAEKIFGYGKGGLIGTPTVKLMPESYRPRHINGLRRFVETGVSEVQGKVLELEALRKNGEVFPIELVLSSFTLGGVINFTGMIRDITERKKAEREKEVIQSQLNQSQKMEAIGRLAGGIAHDFNNILTAIRGNAELGIEMVDKANPARARMNEIILSVLHASKLTRQLLLFGKGHAFELLPLNVNRVIENLLVMISRIIGDNIVISREFSSDLWTIRADEGNIEQVVMNLAVNARDAMPQGGTLTIRTENVALDERKCVGIPGAQPGNYVCLAVRDTGYGMDSDIIEHIFEPFFTTKELGKGVGLGLAVVYGIVRSHNGCIKVESLPGRGTEFRIYLPAMAGGIKEEEAHAPTAPAAVPHGRGERVLLIEDENMVRNFARTALGENGYTVFEAGSAEEAMRVFEREGGKFDLVFSDLVLADRSGLQLADYFASGNPGIAVLITSSYADAGDQREIISRKGFRYLSKPYSMGDLLIAVNDSIERKKIKP